MLPVKDLRRYWTAAGWVFIALVVCLSLVPKLPQPALALNDKLGHLLAYAWLMLWFAQLRASFVARLLLLLGFSLMGLALEFLQGLTQSRHYDVIDMLANASGAALGWLAAHTALGRVLRYFETRSSPRTAVT